MLLDTSNDWWVTLVESNFLLWMVPIVAILSWAVISIVRLNHRHRERLAMIERGMDPNRGGSDSDDDRV